jgi:uncharacterized protein
MSPVVAGDYEPYLDALRQGRIDLPRCGACGRWVWPPVDVCLWCGSGTVEWTPVGPDLEATLFSSIVVHHTSLPEFRDLVPYVVAIVTLGDTGVRVAGRVLGPPVQLAPGTALEPVFGLQDTIPVVNWSAG